MTSVHVQEGPAVLIGYEYVLQIEAEAPLFAEDAAFTAQVRLWVATVNVAEELP